MYGQWVANLDAKGDVELLMQGIPEERKAARAQHERAIERYRERREQRRLAIERRLQQALKRQRTWAWA